MATLTSSNPFRLAQLLSDACGFTDDERRSFSEMVVGVSSWSYLTEKQLTRLIDHLQGAHFFIELMAQRP